MSASGWRIVTVAVALLLTGLLVTPNASYAQRVRPPGSIGGPGGTGGGPGHLPSPPVGAPSQRAPTLSPTLPELAPRPKIETPPTPPAAKQVPAAPVVRFRCDLAPGSYECTKPASEDSSGEEEKCSCARDRCRINRIGNRVCEKLR